MKKNSVFLCLCFFFIGFAAYTQAPVDVFDPFYEDLSIWENSGLIIDAPIARPYPLQEIKRLLEIVIEKGDTSQQRRAQEYHKRFFSRMYHLGGKVEIAVKVPKKKRELNLAPFADMNFTLHPLLTVSGRISAFITNKLFSQSLRPAFQYSTFDLSDDSVHVGPFYVLPVFNTGVAIGNPRYYVTAAIARTNYGPFYENSPLVGTQAMHQGRFNFVVNKEKFTFTQSFLTLTGTDDNGKGAGPGKYLMIHSFMVRALPWLSFGMVDSIVFGKRFEPIYLLPFSAFFISQGLYDFPDNSLIGGMFTVTPMRGLKLNGILYADDLGFNDIVRFKKDAKWRMAGQFGISYTMPKTHWFSFVDLNYTFVFPYTYTHVDHHRTDFRNYSNYTHNGVPLGSNLPPNSDRIHLRLKFRPLYGMDINFFNTFIRHANITESITDTEMLRGYLSKAYNTDGSTLNHATITEPGKTNNETSNTRHAFLHANPFLEQETIQYINQTGIDVACHLPILKSSGYMLFKFGYVFEVNCNEGVNNPIYTPKDGWKGKTGSELAAIPESDIKAEAGRQLSAWRRQAIGTAFRHYIRLTAEFAY